MEKEECKSGKIPFLWQKGKGDMLQKFERREANGKIFYEKVLRVSIQCISGDSEGCIIIV